MKRIVVFVLMVLSIGCFDGDRGILTELLVEPAGAPPPVVLEPLPAEIAAGTGSELVVSPIPAAVEEHLFGEWEADLDTLAGLLRIREISPESLMFICEDDIYRRVYYDKYIDAGGIAIIGPSDRSSPQGVEDEFLYAAREVVLAMTSERPGLREVLSLEHEFGFRYVLMGAGWPIDVNQPRELDSFASTGVFTPVIGGWMAFGGIYFELNRFNNERELFGAMTVAHELAHAIDEAFDWYPHLFPDWGERLTAAYEAASAKAERGESYFRAGDYAMLNEKEYWAVGAEEWFTDMHDDNPRTTAPVNRAEMLRKDPLLYALLDEVFPAAHFPAYIKIVEGE